MNPTPGIVPILSGGIGNQMFIVAASYVAARQAGCPLYIINCTPDNNHNKLSYDYNQLIFKDFGQIVDDLDTTQYTPFTQISEEDWHPAFDPWDPATISPGTKMISNFQYYPPLKPYEDEIRAKFLKALEPFVPPCDTAGAAFLHIRRGDYLDNPLYHFVQTLDYYKEAVKQLRKNVSKIFVISDDMEWVASQGFFRQPIFESFEGDELQTLALMSRCVKGAICGNSTFSWWGAFLGAHAERAPVYVPSDWIDIPVPSLFPEEWIVIQSQLTTNLKN
jgi:hypothetical protein